MEKTHKTNPEDNPTKKSFAVNRLYLSIGVAIILIIGIVAGSFYSLRSQKKQLTTLAEKQNTNLVQLQKKYDELVELIKDDSSEKSDTTSSSKQLLKYEGGTKRTVKFEDDTNVLGLEDSPYIVNMRKQLEVIMQTKPILTSIEENDATVKNIYNYSLLKAFLPNPINTVTKTDAYVKRIQYLLAYSEKSCNLSIKSSTSGYEMSVAMRDAIINDDNPKTLTKFEHSIDELDSVGKEWEAVDTSHISEDLRVEQKKSVESFPKFSKVLRNIAEDIKKQNSLALLKDLRDLESETGTSSETSIVKAVTYWTTHKDIREIDEIKTSWKKLIEQLK